MAPPQGRWILRWLLGEQPLQITAGRGWDAQDTLVRQEGFWGSRTPNNHRTQQEGAGMLGVQVGPPRQDFQALQPSDPSLGSPPFPSFLPEPPERGEGTSVSGWGKKK